VLVAIVSVSCLYRRLEENPSILGNSEGYCSLYQKPIWGAQIFSSLPEPFNALELGGVNAQHRELLLGHLRGRLEHLFWQSVYGRLIELCSSNQIFPVLYGLWNIETYGMSQCCALGLGLEEDDLDIRQN
jgi:hypothetical protein